MKKRFLSIWICLLMVVAVLSPAAVQAEEPGYSRTHYIAVASDRHGDSTAISAAMSGMPQSMEYVCLNGDMVGSGSGDAPAYNYSTIYSEVWSVFRNMWQSGVTIVWGSHDAGVIDDAYTGLKGVYGAYSNSSGLMYTGYENGQPEFYIYEIAYYDMESGSAAPAEAFKRWINTLPDNKAPVIVVCHMPIHAARGDNLSAAYWNAALNYAACGQENGIIKRDVIFLHGHNHTEESDREYFMPAGSRINVPAPGAEDETGSPAAIYYTYITAGYLKANNTATLIGINRNDISLQKYKSGGVFPGNDGTVQGFDVRIKRHRMPYPDAAPDAYYSEPIIDLRSRGIITGYGNGLFGVGDDLLRGQFATILYRIYGSGEKAEGIAFPDVSPGAFYADAVAWASSRGYFTGYDDGYFGPGNGLTVEQMLTVLYRMSGSPGVDGGLDMFRDGSSVSAFARDAVIWAVQNGILHGTDDGFIYPQDVIKRERAAVLIHRFI